LFSTAAHEFAFRTLTESLGNSLKKIATRLIPKEDENEEEEEEYEEEEENVQGRKKNKRSRSPDPGQSAKKQ
jgi:hypothetical protein